MKNFSYSKTKCLILILMITISPKVPAQDSSKVQVNEIGPPQYFAVLVENVDTSVEWYSKTFDLQELGGSEDKDGAWEIMNLGNDRLLVEIIRDDRAKKAERPLGLFKVGFQVPDVRVIANRIAEEQRPRVLEFPRFGIRIIQLHDPDSNTIQLSSPLTNEE